MQDTVGVKVEQRGHQLTSNTLDLHGYMRLEGSAYTGALLMAGKLLEWQWMQFACKEDTYMYRETPWGR